MNGSFQQSARHVGVQPLGARAQCSSDTLILLARSADKSCTPTVPAPVAEFNAVGVIVKIFLALILFQPSNTAGLQIQPTKKFQRQIFVPFDSLDVLLDGNSNRVLLTRDEYEELLESAQTREIQRAPLDSAVVSARYQGVVSEGVAQISGQLIVEPLNDGLVQIPLPFSGVALRSAKISSGKRGEEPANLWRNSDGKIVLLMTETGRQTLTVEMTVPLQTTAARQAMTLQLPAPSATKFELVVPGNVEIKSGAAVIERKYDEESDTTEFDLLPTKKPMNLVMSLNNRLLKDEQVVVARSVLFHKLTPDVQEMHLTCSLDVIHGAMEEISFDVPSGFEVSQVSTELISQWVIEKWPVDSDQTGQRLRVSLRQPTRDDIVLNLTATKTEGAVGDWTAQAIAPVDIAGHVAVVGVLADVRLQSANLKSESLIPIDHQFLMNAIPDSLHGSNTNDPVSFVAAYYAPQAQYSISASFVVPAPELIVKSSSRLVVSDQRLELQSGLSLVSRHDSRFSFQFSLPQGWRLDEISDVKNSRLKFDRLENKSSSDFLIHLPHRLTADAATKVFFKATLTPDGWLEKWDSIQVEFPGITIVDQTQHSGVIAIATPDDISIQPSRVSELELLDEADQRSIDFDRGNAPLAYQFHDPKFELTLALKRLEPSVIARTYSFFTIQPDHLKVHAELVFKVRQAKQGQFSFDVPLDSPKSISLKLKDGLLKDYRSEETDSVRRWIVELAKPRKGDVHLLVDFQIPKTADEINTLELAPVVARDVAFQSARVAVEGSNELDIEIETDGRVVDVGELAESIYQPGRHTLGVYSWPNENLSLVVRTARRPIYGLPSAIVQRAEMVTSLSNNGKSETAARFQLVTKQTPFLRVELPTGSTLWSAMVDGQPAKPQRHGEALLISLIGNKSGQLRDLQLVYESPSKEFRFVGTVAAHAPTLWLNENVKETGQPVPLVDLHWKLMLPDGFAVSHGNGDFQSDQMIRRPSPIEQLGRWVYQLGGGIPGMRFKRSVKRQAWLTDDVQLNSSGSLGRESEFGELFSASESDGLHAPLEAAAAKKEESIPRVTAEPSPQKPSTNAPKTAPPPANQTANDFKQDEGKSAKANKTRLWALSGLRSLEIELTQTGNSIDFYNLGEQPVLSATVVHHSRVNWVAIALALLIAALGVLLTHKKLKTKIFFLIFLLLVACLLPLSGSAFDALATVIDLAILAVIFVACYFLVAMIVKTVCQVFFRVATRIPLFGWTVLMAVGISTFGISNTAQAQRVVNDVNELKQLIRQLQSEPNVTLPNDAIIIPFDVDDPQGRENAQRLLVPYEHYLSLLNRADLDKQPLPVVSPVGYVLASAHYETQLTLEEDITISGTLVIELLTDEPVAIALPLSGGALASATVDGEPAKLQFLNRPAAAGQQKSAPQQTEPPAQSSVVQLHLEGRGRKIFKFTVAMKPQRQGGWRLIDARLPVGMTRGLDLKSLPDPTEVRLNSDADQRSIEATPNQEIATVLSADGKLRLQWKPSTAQQAIDQSLTAQSEAIFDVREDGLRLSWRVELDFRGSERDVFTLGVPDNFLVESVTGENVRAWDVKENDFKENDFKEDDSKEDDVRPKSEKANDAQKNKLNVTLLSAAKDRETFTVELSRRDFSVDDESISFDAPYLNVEGAALHKGNYTVRRSPIVELKTAKLRSANRIDANQIECKIDVEAIDTNASPLGIERFQSLEFRTTPFQIGLTANLVPRSVTATTQSLLRMGQSEADWEMKMIVNVLKRPIYDFSFDLPANIEIRSLTANVDETWTTETENGVQHIQLFFPAGVSGEFSIVVDSNLSDYSGADRWPIPRVQINGVEKQTGEFAVQVDPAYEVKATNTKNCELVLLSQIRDWLNREQKAATQLAIRTKGADYNATLGFTKINPLVTVETVTNVRTTLFAIEETILLDFNIQRAGIRQIQFTLPVNLRRARIVAKLVSETRIEEIADNPKSVLVTLVLQDEVIDSYRVVIENDRPLSELESGEKDSDDPKHSVPFPEVLTGELLGRFATLQNAGRDEIKVLPSKSFQLLNRQLRQFQQLKNKLSGGEVTLAYFANTPQANPTLQFETKRREVFDTVAASIEFSKTVMVVDSSGAYRAAQTFQVNNRSEQYLEIELPHEARLFTVVVDGRAVKPVAWPAGRAPLKERRLRVPLVKTSAGELDYPVELKYGGQLGELHNWSEVQFPVVETLNINVQLSQLHLRLPESHQWLNFDGTMTKVDNQGELEEGYLSYKRRQIQQLAEEIQQETSKLGSFGRSRAYDNLRILEKDMQDYESKNGRRAPSSRESNLEGMIKGNQDAIRFAQEKYLEENKKASGIIVDNRANFNGLVEQQSAKISRNSVTKGGNYFEENGAQGRGGQTVENFYDDFGVQGGAGQSGEGQRGAEQNGEWQSQDQAGQQTLQNFDGRWFEKNKLSQSGGKPALKPGSKAQPLPQQIVIRNDELFEDSISFENSFGSQSEDGQQSGGQDDPFGDKSDDESEMARGRAGGQGGGGQGGGGLGGGGQGGGGQDGGGQGGGWQGGIQDGLLPDIQQGDWEGMDLALPGEDRDGAKDQSFLELDEKTQWRSSNEDTSTPSDGLNIGGGQTIAGDDAWLSSLEIELPSRGVDFFFKSPRGKSSVTARPVAARAVSRWTSALTTIAVCVCLWILCLAVSWLRKFDSARWITSLVLLLAGLFSLATGTFPIYGVVAILSAVVLFFDWVTEAVFADRRSVPA